MAMLLLHSQARLSYEHSFKLSVATKENEMDASQAACGLASFQAFLERSVLDSLWSLASDEIAGVKKVAHSRWQIVFGFSQGNRLKFCHRKLHHILHCKKKRFVTWNSLWEHARLTKSPKNL